MGYEFYCVLDIEAEDIRILACEVRQVIHVLPELIFDKEDRTYELANSLLPAGGFSKFLSAKVVIINFFFFLSIE
jgi:hypothetical protein